VSPYTWLGGRTLGWSLHLLLLLTSDHILRTALMQSDYAGGKFIVGVCNLAQQTRSASNVTSIASPHILRSRSLWQMRTGTLPSIATANEKYACTWMKWAIWKNSNEWRRSTYEGVCITRSAEWASDEELMEWKGVYSELHWAQVYRANKVSHRRMSATWPSQSVPGGLLFTSVNTGWTVQ